MSSVLSATGEKDAPTGWPACLVPAPIVMARLVRATHSGTGRREAPVRAARNAEESGRLLANP